MSGIHVETTPEKTILRVKGEAGNEELLNSLLSASEEAAEARESYRSFFIQVLALVGLVAFQVSLGIDTKLILRGVLLAFIIATAIQYWRKHFTHRRYLRLRTAWWKAVEHDPTWKDLPK